MSYTKAARVQASRNIRGYPLAMRINRPQRRKLEILLKNILIHLNGPYKGKYYKLCELNNKQIKLLRDRDVHVDKPAVHTGLGLSGCNRDWPDGRGIFINDNMNFVVLTNHSDHLLIVSCDNQIGDLKTVFERWSIGIMIIEGYLNRTPFPINSKSVYSKSNKLKNNETEMINNNKRELKRTENKRQLLNGEEKDNKGAEENSIHKTPTKNCEFQYSDRLGYVACSPQNLGSGLYSSITLELPELGEHEDSLKILCENMGLRAVNIHPKIMCEKYNSDSVENKNKGVEVRDKEREKDQEIQRREWIEEDREEGEEDNDTDKIGTFGCMKGMEEETKDVDQKIFERNDRGGKEDRKEESKIDINNMKNKIVKSDEEKISMMQEENICNYRINQPIIRTIYEISNKDCMGQSEVQLTQKVIDGVSAIIEIEKKIEDGSRVDDFLSIPATPPLPPPPLCKVPSGSTLALLMGADI